MSIYVTLGVKYVCFSFSPSHQTVEICSTLFIERTDIGKQTWKGSIAKQHNIRCRVSIITQHIKQTLAASALCILGPLHSPGTSVQIQLPVHMPGKAMESGLSARDI